MKYERERERQREGGGGNAFFNYTGCIKRNMGCITENSRILYIVTGMFYVHFATSVSYT